jgi:hypothetical protein
MPKTWRANPSSESMVGRSRSLGCERSFRCTLFGRAVKRARSAFSLPRKSAPLPHAEILQYHYNLPCAMNTNVRK